MSEIIILKNNPKIEFQLLANGFEICDSQTEQNSGFYPYKDLQSVELNNIWFGVAISDKFKGKGIGKKIMSYLINYADYSEIIELKLSVDTDNIIALKMYEKFGFVVEKKLETNVLIMKRNKNEA